MALTKSNNNTQKPTEANLDGSVTSDVSKK
jgi:hypothetical protein